MAPYSKKLLGRFYLLLTEILIFEMNEIYNFSAKNRDLKQFYNQVANANSELGINSKNCLKRIFLKKHLSSFQAMQMMNESNTISLS